MRGKKSSQTFQDAKVYGIDQYYGVYPGLRREMITRVLHRLEEEKAIERVDESRVTITGVGRQELSDSDFSLYFSGMEYSEAVNQFQDRLLLWVQVLSNAAHRQDHYFPVVEKTPVQQWVKTFYNREKRHLQSDAAALFRELNLTLQPFTDMEKNLFVRRFTGGDGTGWTYDQLAETGDIEPIDVPLYIKNMHYYLFFTAAEDRTLHLHKLTGDLVKKETLTASSKKSIQLFDQYQSIEDVAAVRGLKTSTIEDHLVEAVLVDPGRPVDAFISDSGFEEIRQVVRKTGTKRLKIIHDQLNGGYSYFQLRIVLAKLQKG
ncbi:helix-turn-helix domain-containing protein [Salimicrobium halophilum]|uniref:helix-turn-helix domain-containing protein n=1 Tax=Salimicrobium halophilum TaxID=86666 RepID=UPI0015A4BEBF|nr:helix-turn-helix domain-containing protein [Salimicrobium halophilum]